MDDSTFTENWYEDEQIELLKGVCKVVKGLEGAVIEIGCWEGKSTIAIANTLPDDTLIAVDTWKGSAEEAEDHPTVVLSKERDILAKFKENIKNETSGNVEIKQTDCHIFEKEWEGKIKLLHIDACHDYDNVIETLDALKGFIVDGGIICGDDFANASIKRRDLNGGVERAVREAFPKIFFRKNFWVFLNSTPDKWGDTLG